MADEYDWRRRLKTSESKSKGSDTGNSVMMSSIDGWNKQNLPKLLIIWRFDKERSDRFPSNSRPGRFSKARDLSATIVSYELFLIDSEHYIVPWMEKPSHSELVKTKWSKKWHEKLSEKVDKLHKKYSDRPIKFQKSFKNEGGIIRLQYQVSNYKNLPKCPPDLENLLSPELDRLVGSEFKLWKDLSMYSGGPKGWLDNNMAKWEHTNIKHHGLLSIKMEGGNWIEYPDFKKGREDYWTGYAIDFLMDKKLPTFKDLGGHAKGADHRLEFENKQTRITDYGQKENTGKMLFSRIKKLFRL